jgi:sulfide:quinone oxidoreductase
MAARVVIAGAGPAGIEAALGLRELAPEGTDITVVAPTSELRHQALGDDHFSMGALTRHPLETVCERVPCGFVHAAVESVDTDARTVTLSDGRSLEYDVLLVAIGARRVMSLDHAVLFGSPIDAPAVDELLQLVKAGRAKRLAVVVPPAAAWTLPAYDVALRAAEAGGQAVVITPEERPASVFGSASDAVREALDAAGVEVVQGRAADIEPGCIVLDDDERVAADGIVALPWVRGPRTPGLPHDTEGFLPIDPWCKVDGVEHVYGAGDGTSFPVRQGGVASQQAAVAALSVARELGADLDPEPLSAVVRGVLPVSDGRLWLEHDLKSGTARASREPLWDPPHRIAGVRLPALLERLA